MNRDRDRILEQALKHELRAAGTPPAGACLDAETLGAWTDGGLSPAALAAAEAHVSNCARCQALVATMTKSAPSLGTQGTPGALGTLSLWRWWLAPIAAGVTAVTLWMVVPEQQQVAVAPPQSKAAGANAVQPPAAAAESVAPPAQAFGADRDQAARRTDQLAAAATKARKQATVERERKEEQPTEAKERGALADAAAPGSRPAPAVAPAAPAIAALQETVTIALPLPPGVDINDQSAPSPSVSWYVGRAGLVMLTTDGGKTFTKVDFPEPLDLATVVATDAKSATVMTTAGRRFHTDDGGRTWRPI